VTVSGGIVKMLKLLACAIFLFNAPLSYSDQDIIGSDGAYQGHIEDDGTMISPSGAYQGHVESDGSMISPSGAYQGHVEQDGTIISPSGGYRGNVEGGEGSNSGYEQ